MRITSRRDKTRKGAAGEGTVGFGLIAFSTRDIEKENVYIKSNATKRNLRTLIATNRGIKLRCNCDIVLQLHLTVKCT